MILPTHLWLFGLLRLVMIVLWLAKVVVFEEVCKVLFGSFLRGGSWYGFYSCYSCYRGYRIYSCYGVYGFLLAPTGRGRTPDRALLIQAVCSKLSAGETPAPPVFFLFGAAWSPHLLESTFSLLILCFFSAHSLLFLRSFSAFFFVSFSSRFRVVFEIDG